MTHSETVWSRTAEADRVSIELWRQIAIEFNQPRSTYSEQLRTLCVKKTKLFEENSNNYSNIFSNGKWYIILGERRARESRVSESEAEPAKSWTRKPELQKSRSLVSCHEPVSQCQWADEAVGQCQGLYQRSEINFIYRRGMFMKDEWKCVL